MYSELKKCLSAEVDFYDCKSRLQFEKNLIKALMHDLHIATLFVTYNSLLDNLQVYAGNSFCSDELVCCCDECINSGK